MAATIKDIARKLNLSVSTVSYALNDGPKPVSIKTREDVLRTARELDYRPNRLAKTLVTGRTHCIGVVPPTIHQDMMLSTFVQRALNGIVNVAEDHGQDLVLFTGSNRNRPDLVANDLLDSRIDGVIFLAPHADSRLPELLQERGFPFAVISSGRKASGPGFEIDNVCGTTMALGHLWDLGHRRIAHIKGDEQSGDARARYEAYLQFFNERGEDIPEGYIVESNFLFDSGYIAARKLLRLPQRPTAIFAANDETALGAMEYAKSAGLDIPADLSIVGFDDSELGARARPALTTVRQPVEEMGELATHAVLAQIAGCPAVGHRFPTALIVRQSTSSPKEDKP